MDEEQERSANLLFLDEGVTDASLDALLATGAKALPGCVSRRARGPVVEHRSLPSQQQRGSPWVYGVVISSRRESSPVQANRRSE
jgi:hypothetical protein